MGLNILQDSIGEECVVGSATYFLYKVDTVGSTGCYVVQWRVFLNKVTHVCDMNSNLVYPCT